jgi:hypothetical protein
MGTRETRLSGKQPKISLSVQLRKPSVRQEDLEDDIPLISGTYQFRAFFHAAPRALHRAELNVLKMKSPWLLRQPRAFC